LRQRKLNLAITRGKVAPAAHGYEVCNRDRKGGGQQLQRLRSGSPRLHRQLMREGIEFHLEGLREEGLPIPEPTTQVDYAEIAA
jgi:hypothetical protein